MLHDFPNSRTHARVHEPGSLAADLEGDHHGRLPDAGGPRRQVEGGQEEEDEEAGGSTREQGPACLPSDAVRTRLVLLFVLLRLLL